ncbi:MAG: MFS transporter [Geothermobacteraceae bacterium]
MLASMPLILLATILTLSALYAPQPLLPTLADTFGVSRDAAALLVTLTFIPLALAPLGYGYLLQAVEPRRVLRTCFALLGLSALVFAASKSFALLLAIRLFQGLLVPALLTSLMTYVSRRSGVGDVQRQMAIYIAATILGGFLGRLVSGALAAWTDWRVSFVVLGCCLLGLTLLLGRLPAAGGLELARPRPALLAEVLGRGFFLRLYLAVFCLFLVFAGVMNFIPFRLTDLSEQANELRIGLMYSGYLMGVVSSLSATRLCRRLGGELRVLCTGFGLYLLACLLLAVPDVRLLFVNMFLFCGGMFLVHATASGWINRFAGSHKGVVNGLYIAFYYGGGAIGSSAPGPVYAWFGWNGVVAGLVLTALAGLALALSLIPELRRGVQPFAAGEG